MRPGKDDDTISIPITFDAYSRGRLVKRGKGMWVFFIALFWLFISVVAVITAEGVNKLTIPLFSFIFLSLVVRFVVMRERYFFKKKKELKSNNYSYPLNLIWDIYSEEDALPYTVQFSDGKLGIFVALELDVITGKGSDNEYYHYEAIASAYKQVAKTGLQCCHIDYMDTVGKDDRMQGLYAMALEADNPDVKKVVLSIYDHLVARMNHVYSTYDVYCFYGDCQPNILYDRVKSIIRKLERANYKKAVYLDAEDKNNLVASLFGLMDFSSTLASKSLYSSESESNYIRVIWVEKDGERTQISKTTAEIEEAKRITKAEKKMKKVKQPKKKKEKVKRKQKGDIVDEVGIVNQVVDDDDDDIEI